MIAPNAERMNSSRTTRYTDLETPMPEGNSFECTAASGGPTQAMIVPARV